MISSDSLFYTLPKHLQRVIDDAFDATINPNEISRTDHPRTRSSSAKIFAPASISIGGGFLMNKPSGGGGFLVEDDIEVDPNVGEEPTQIPLELVPSALQRLDLPPDDDEILAVFKNAASGWTSSSLQPSQSSGAHGEETYVGRDDWRSVCAVLLENRPEQDDGEGGVMDEDDDGVSDEYMEDKSSSEQDLSSDVSSDEYTEARGRVSSSRRQTRPRKLARLSSPGADASAGKPQKLTNRQLQTCLATFALFFEGVPSEELTNQKIMIKDLQRVAKLLNEKLKADEMVEMLEMFSTSLDKSMNFDDFCRMMVTAKLA